MSRLAMRSPLRAYPTVEAARGADRAASPWWRSLDGEWDFELFASPTAVPDTVTDPGHTLARTIPVPSNWTVQDTGDLPNYTNIQMPWSTADVGLPPAIPAKNPTGVHRRTFTVPSAWKGRRVVLHIGAADSTHGVWVNGDFVGYGTDNRLASEYDITPYLRKGARTEQTVTVIMSRYSAQSYVEDQDQWWMAGLHREVFLEARAAVHLHDVQVTAAASGDITAKAIAARPDGFPVGAGYTVRAHLETLAGRRLGREQRGEIASNLRPYVYVDQSATMTWNAGDVDLWSAEAPNRYRVIVALHDPDGELVEATSVVTGFRTVEIKGRDLLVNGKRIIVRGVNRHDHHPDRGKALTFDDIRADLLQMKRHNVNALRCSHYPNDPRLLDLADELGLYVVDEANIECHGFNTSLSHDPAYQAAWLARGSRMVERDRNHPSIIFWSLGNESGYGVNHDALAAWIRWTDPSRPLHYEGAIAHAGWIDGGLLASDVVCPMYATIDAVREYGESGRGTRPLIMCEYNHAMGNSNGSLADYWDVFEHTPGVQGGFIWEWKDHGIRQQLPGGGWRFAYGGQFGDVPNDGNFVADGLNSSDLIAHPGMREMMWCHRPAAVSLVGRGAKRELAITNRRSFTDLSDLRTTWELLVDGKRVAKGVLAVPTIAAEQTVRVDLPADVPAGSGEVHLTVRWFQRKATPWSPAGHLVAWDQVELRAARPDRHDSTEHPITAGFGVLSRVDDPPPLMAALNMWRAPVDNDGFKLMPHITFAGSKALTKWQAAGLDRLELVDRTQRGRTTTERWQGATSNDVITHTLVTKANLFTHTIEIPRHLDDLPRVGVTWTVPESDTVKWFGRGPHENYTDRNRSAMLGIWEQPLDEMPYLVPQEYGLRTDCRWMQIGPLRFTAVEPTALHMAAVRYSPAELTAAADLPALGASRQTLVHIDVAQRGLGSGSCGPDTRAEYLVGAGTYAFAYRVSPSALAK